MRKVEIEIHSAKVVNTNCKGNLKTVGRDDISPTDVTNDMENLIHFNHISNMLHVMLGSRPVSSRYGEKRKRSTYIDDIVSNGLLRYDNIVRVPYETKEGKKCVCYNNEFTQGKKPFINSNRQNIGVCTGNGEICQSYLTWSKLKEKKLYSENCKNALQILLEFGDFLGVNNIQKEYSLTDILIMLRDYPEWKKKLFSIKVGIDPIKHFINKEDSSGFNSLNERFSPNRAALSNMNAVTPKVSIDATIVLFLTDEDATNLLNGKLFATILDGGYAKIKANPKTVRDLPYIDESEINDVIDDYLSENFIKINFLPTTKNENKN